MKKNLYFVLFCFLFGGLNAYALGGDIVKLNKNITKKYAVICGDVTKEKEVLVFSKRVVKRQSDFCINKVLSEKSGGVGSDFVEREDDKSN